MLKEPGVKHTATFLAKVSHELKSPIHGILGISEYLLDNWEEVDDNKKKICLSELNNTAGALNFLVLSLLNTHAIDNEEIRYNLSKIHFKDHIDSIMSSVRIFLIHKQGLSIKTDIDVETDEILADSVWFKQLLSNIFINAIKFSSDGEIVFKIREGDIQGKNYYIFSVSDEGEGVPEKELPSIFRPFETGARDMGSSIGVGLGLSICAEIVKAHGGEIRGYNNKDRGLTVEFTIPKLENS